MRWFWAANPMDVGGGGGGQKRREEACPANCEIVTPWTWILAMTSWSIVGHWDLYHMLRPSRLLVCILSCTAGSGEGWQTGPAVRNGGSSPQLCDIDLPKAAFLSPATSKCRLLIEWLTDGFSDWIYVTFPLGYRTGLWLANHDWKQDRSIITNK